MRIARWVSPTAALGPGNRVALWMVGCSRGCKGCISPELQDAKAGYEIDDKALAKILNIQLSSKNIDGLTISGGEPLDQPEALEELLKIIECDDVLLYTGYPFAQVIKMPVWEFLSKRITAIIPEPFIEEHNNGEPLRGSNNQPIIVLKKEYLQLYKNEIKKPRVVQATEVEDGVIFTGIVPNNTETVFREE